MVRGARARAQLLISIAITAVASTATPAHATTTTTNHFGSSFVDYNNNGVYDAGTDKLLSSLFSATDDYPQLDGFDLGDHVGIVLQGNLSFVGGFTFYMNGKVSVSGGIKAPDGFELQSRNNVDTADPGVGMTLAPNLKVSTGSYYIFETTGDMTIGTNGRYQSRGDFDYDQFNADGTITVGKNVSISATNGPKGYNEADLQIYGTNVVVGDGLSMRANKGSEVDLMTNGDLTANKFYASAGVITVGDVEGSDDGQAHRVTLTNSYLNEPDPDGYVEIDAAADSNGNYLPNAVTLVKTKIQHAGELDIRPS